MNFKVYITLYAATIVGFLVVGTLVALRQRTILYRNFALFCFLIALWQSLQFVAQAFLNDSMVGSWLFRFSVVASCFVAMYFLFFAAAYAEQRLHTLLYFTGAITASTVSLFSPGLQAAQLSKIGISLPSIDLQYGFSLSFAGICGVYAVLLILYKTITSRTQAQRQQGILLFVGVLQSLLVVLYITLFTPQSSSTQVGIPVAALLAVVIIAYAMIFRGLFNIHFFVLRAAAYLSSVLLVTVLCIVPVVLLFSYFLDFRPHLAQFMLIVGASSVAVYGMYYLKNKFDKITTRIFFRHYYDPQDVLSRVSSLLAGTIEVDEMKTGTEAILQDTVGVSRVSFLLAADKTHTRLLKSITLIDSPVIVVDELESRHAALRENLRKDGIALVIKLHTTREDLGFMAVGYMRSGALYSVTDQRLLVAVAAQLAIGLQNALRFIEIQEFNVTLQEKIEEATRKLRQTNEKLRTLDQTKDDFISMASHQLRTPLTSVKGYVSMVLDGDAGKLTALQRKLLNQSFISAQRMVYLISDLLNVSRLRTGRFVIEPVPCNLAKVIKDEVDQLQETAKGRSLALTFTHPEHFPTLMLDETKIRQVIMNFIDNAIYYTPSGGHITINLIDKPGNIEFTVTDDGIGVPRHEQHHLFTKFFRAHNAKRARPDGTGLGLFMAKKVVIAQGGAIIFKSSEGKGSTFGFTFAKDKLAKAPIPKTLSVKAK